MPEKRAKITKKDGRICTIIHQPTVLLEKWKRERGRWGV
jgi:hypothetical protein